MATVLELMGLKEGEIGESDSLAEMGLDSLQLVEIRSKVQSAIGRPLPLEQVHYSATHQPLGSFLSAIAVRMVDAPNAGLKLAGCALHLNTAHAEAQLWLGQQQCWAQRRWTTA